MTTVLSALSFSLFVCKNFEIGYNSRAFAPTSHTLVMPYYNKIMIMCLYIFYMQVNVSMILRTAHMNGSDTSSLCFSYDGRVLASRGGKKHCCRCLLVMLHTL